MGNIVVRRELRDQAEKSESTLRGLQSRTKLAKTKHHFKIDQGHHSYDFQRNRKFNAKVAQNNGKQSFHSLKPFGTKNRGRKKKEGLERKESLLTSVIHPKIFAWKHIWFSEIYIRP